MTKHMNKIEKLIEELCPNGVKYSKIAEITDDKFWIMPATPKFLTDGDIPYITSKNIRGGNINFGNIKHISKESYQKISKNRPIIKDDILISMIGTIGEVARVKESDLDFYGQNMYLIRLNQNKIDISFFLHFFDSKIMRTYFSGVKNNSGQGYLKAGQVDGIMIPIPPLPIQQEIVKILDIFTQLEAELEAELEARKQQYEYYREEMLSFGEDIKWMSLDDVCLKTSNIKWNKNEVNEYQYIDLSSVNRQNNKVTQTATIDKNNAPSRAKQVVLKNDVIFGTTRPTLKRYALIQDEHNNQICSTGFCVLRSNKDITSSKFLFFNLKSNRFLDYVENNQEGAGYPSISNTKVKAFKIPIPQKNGKPDLEKQKEIVEVLDKFDTLVNDISEGLPAEIEARRKQYEYYREKLLTFKELEK